MIKTKNKKIFKSVSNLRIHLEINQKIVNIFKINKNNIIKKMIKNQNKDQKYKMNYKIKIKNYLIKKMY